jgi:hypothetical protein
MPVEQSNTAGSFPSENILLTGRELDAAIAVEVMGWRRHETRFEPCGSGGIIGCWNCSLSCCSPPWTSETVDGFCGRGPDIRSSNLPHYSTDIAAAWQMMDDMFPSSYFIEIDNGWREVNGERASGWNVRIVGPGFDVEAFAETLSLAMCRAALKAVRSK